MGQMAAKITVTPSDTQARGRNRALRTRIADDQRDADRTYWRRPTEPRFERAPPTPRRSCIGKWWVFGVLNFGRWDNGSTSELYRAASDPSAPRPPPAVPRLHWSVVSQSEPIRRPESAQKV